MKKIILFKVSILLSFFVHSADLEKKDHASYLLSLFDRYSDLEEICLEENLQQLEQSIVRFLDTDMDKEEHDIVCYNEPKYIKVSPEYEKIKDLFSSQYVDYLYNCKDLKVEETPENPFYYGPMEALILAPISAYLELRNSDKIFMSLITEEEVIRDIDGRIKLHRKLFKESNCGAHNKLREIIMNAKGISEEVKTKIFISIGENYFDLQS